MRSGCSGHRGQEACGPRPQAEQGFVERSDERGAIPVEQGLDKRAPDHIQRRRLGGLPCTERTEAFEMIDSLASGLAQESRRPHRRCPEPVGAAEDRRKRLAQLLRAERLVREQRQLPAVQPFRKVGVVVCSRDPRQQVLGELPSERVET